MGEGVIENQFFFQIQNSPNYPGGGQENYGLFPQIMVFFYFEPSPNLNIKKIMRQ